MEKAKKEGKSPVRDNVEKIGGDTVGGDKIVATVGNVSSGQVAIGKNIQQTQTSVVSSEPFKTDEFLQELRELKKIIAGLKIDDDVKEEIEDNISTIRQEVKKAKEEKKEPDKDKLNECLKKTNAIVDTLSKVGGVGVKILPYLANLARLAGLPIP
jgi:hypothetical protein